jgi:hypothetical protein
MSGFWLALLLVFDFGICWWNAYVAGKVWAETKALGGFMRLVAWCAAIQSAAGFTMIFAILLGLLGMATHLLNAKLFDLMMNMNYLLVIFPILGSGFIITIHSWIAAYRERDLTSMGTAAYNTFAMSYDTYQAFDGIGSAFGSVLDDLKGDDDDAGWLIVVALLLIAVLCGVFLTTGIIRHYAGTMSLPASRPGRIQAAEFQSRQR